MIAIIINLTIGWWILPTLITLFALFRLIVGFTDARGAGGIFDFGLLAVMFEALWLIPALLSWTIYFSILYFTK